MLRLSYVGTHYRGSQKHANSTVVDADSIQGAIESSFTKLQPLLNNIPTINLAGRTDAGVHALHMTAHIDLEHKSGETHFDTSNLVRMMNRYLISCGHDIRIFSCHEVSKNFHARFSAKSRSYLYRFLMAKDPCNHQIPISEFNRTFHLHPYPDKFDLEKMKAGIKLFQGRKDFTTFSAKRIDKMNGKYKSATRTMHIKMEEAQPLMPSDPRSNDFVYWNLLFTSQSFLYNQIRRITGALIALGTFRVSEEDIITMLQVPSHNNWNPHATPAPPHGLYLLNVEYDEEISKNISKQG